MLTQLVRTDIVNVKTPFMLRNYSDPQAGVMYIMKAGKYSGMWYFDPADASSADNLGTIVVNTTTGARFKRFFEGYVYNTWFGSADLFFSSTTDANSKIPSSQRKRGLTVIIDVSGTLTEYWYRDGVADTDLVAK